MTTWLSVAHHPTVSSWTQYGRKSYCGISEITGDSTTFAFPVHTRVSRENTNPTTGRHSASFRLARHTWSQLIERGIKCLRSAVHSTANSRGSPQRWLCGVIGEWLTLTSVDSKARRECPLLAHGGAARWPTSALLPRRPAEPLTGHVTLPRCRRMC